MERSIERFLSFLLLAVFGILLPTFLYMSLTTKSLHTTLESCLETTMSEWVSKGAIDSLSYEQTVELISQDCRSLKITVSGVKWGDDAQTHEITYTHEDILNQLENYSIFEIPDGYTVTLLAYYDTTLRNSLLCIFGGSNHINITTSAIGGIYCEH